MPTYIPLIGGDGPDRKRPAVSGWAKPDYLGVALPDPAYGMWVGLRADGLVIVDCDNAEALERWWDHVGHEGKSTLTRSTPRGWHLFYRLPEGQRPYGPHADILGQGSGVDLRSGRGSFVVYQAPGYETIRAIKPIEWNPMWWHIAEHARLDSDRDWNTIPDGSRDATLFGIASDLRGRGAGEEVILRAIAAVNDVCVPPVDREDLLRIAKSAAGYDAGLTLVLEDDEVEVEHVERKHVIPTVPASRLSMPKMPTWFWEPFILNGTATMVEGREGIGKGLLAAFLALRSAKAGREVLWFVSEDDIQQDLLPRLVAAGWDREQHAEIRFVPVQVPFSLPDSAPDLLAEVKAGAYGLVIFDPVKSFAGAVDGFEATGNSDMYVRKVYEPISQAAMVTGTPVITVGHWRKSTGSTKDASLGSVAWRAVPRAVVQLAGNQTQDGGAISLDKANNAKGGGVTEYHIRVAEVEYADGPRDVPYFELGSPLDFTTLDEWIEAQQGEEKEQSKHKLVLSPSFQDVIEAIRAVVPPGAKIRLTRDDTRATLNNILVEHFGNDVFSELLLKPEAIATKDLLLEHGIVTYTPGTGGGYRVSPRALEAG